MPIDETPTAIASQINRCWQVLVEKPYLMQYQVQTHREIVQKDSFDNILNVRKLPSVQVRTQEQVEATEVTVYTGKVMTANEIIDGLALLSDLWYAEDNP